MWNMLGLAEAIGQVFAKVLQGVARPIFKILIDWIITPILTAVVTLIKHAISCALYGLSVFLLKLVDFVEILFRALAGLDPTGEGRSYVELSLDGKSGDILLQLIRHKDIQSAFLAMCIVGLFLLVVTTVFQIIKTEYTTEGAKNAKGPLFQKAFKALSNLMLLPLLVVFGIVFANQLLGLLDKATKPNGANPTISGIIFMTGAEEAYYRGNEVNTVGVAYAIAPDYRMAMYTAPIGVAVNFFTELFSGNDPWDRTNNKYYKSDEDREKLSAEFIDGTRSYANYAEVVSYFNVGEINFILIFCAGIFVLKSLYYTCFGLVIRLYKCAVLFVMSPVIIGMTPINEGGLGKWRSSFIGQVLSAYGTVLALNLFFIIVRVLLKIELNFVNPATDFADTGFSDRLMTSIFKAILVIAGCILIEQFAKEIGGYFGADDAMGSGKSMSKQVGDVAMSGIKAAAGIAMAVGTGGASLAGKAAGIAGKIGGGISKVGGAIGGGFSKLGDVTGATLYNATYKDVLKKGGSRKEAREAAKAAVDKKKMDEAELTRGKNFVKRQAGYDSHIADIDDKIADIRKKEKYLGLDENDRTRLASLQSGRKQIESMKASDREKFNKETSDDYKTRGTEYKAKKALEAEEDAKKRKAEEEEKKKEKKKADAEAKRKERSEENKKRLGGIGATILSYGQGALINTKNQVLNSGFLGQFKKDFDNNIKTGDTVIGDNIKTARKWYQEQVDIKDPEKKLEGNPIFASLNKTLLTLGAAEATAQSLKNLQTQQLTVQSQANDLLKTYAQAIDLKSTYANQQILSLTEKLQSLGAGLEFKDVQAKLVQLQANPTINFNLEDLHAEIDEKKLKKAIENAMKNGGDYTAIIDAIKGEFENIAKDGNSALMKALVDVIQKTMSEINK